MIPYFFYRFNLAEQIVFARKKVLQYFFAYLKLRACLNIKFPMDFSNRSAHHCSSESFININELTFIIFLWDGNYIIPAVQMPQKIQNVQGPLFWVSSLICFASVFLFSIFNLSHIFPLGLPLCSHSVAHILHSCRVILRLVVLFICPPSIARMTLNFLSVSNNCRWISDSTVQWQKKII